MAIALKEIRDAVYSYFSSISTTVTSSGIPAGQSSFNPNEEVTYDVKVVNHAATDGIQLKNVRLHLSVSSPALRLVTPPATVATAYTTQSGSVTTPANTEVSQMFLGNPALASLAPGEIITLAGLKLRSKEVGNGSVFAHVHGEVDMSWLLPADDTSSNGSKSFSVVT